MRSRTAACALCLIGAVFLSPMLIAACASFMGAEELASVFKSGAPVRLIPYEATLGGYGALLLESQTYLATFWNSMGMALSIPLGQAAASLIVAFLLAKARVRLSGALRFLYVVAALMPFQVTLLPNYILARQLHIYNTWWALILPGAFAPFGVFLLHQLIQSMPDEVLDAAVLETGSLPRLLCAIVAPIAKPEFIAVAIMAFAEGWNMVEQPLVLLKDEWLYPLSLKLNGLKATGTEILFPGAVLFVVPTVLLYFLFGDELVNGLSTIRF